jgi:hypothetical protein
MVYVCAAVLSTADARLGHGDIVVTQVRTRFDQNREAALMLIDLVAACRGSSRS